MNHLEPPLSTVLDVTHSFGVALAQNCSMLLHLVWGMEEYFVTIKLSATPMGLQVIQVSGISELPEKKVLTNNTDDCGKVHDGPFS